MGRRGQWSEFCSHCGQKITERIRLEARQRKIEKNLATIRAKRAAGKLIGRPRRVDIQKVRELRERGLSIREIARELSCSTWPVLQALK